MDWMLSIRHPHFHYIHSEKRLSDSLNLPLGGGFQVTEGRHDLFEEWSTYVWRSAGLMESDTSFFNDYRWSQISSQKGRIYIQSSKNSNNNAPKPTSTSVKSLVQQQITEYNRYAYAGYSSLQFVTLSPLTSSPSSSPYLHLARHPLHLLFQSRGWTLPPAS